jgi:hypothetical protein
MVDIGFATSVLNTRAPSPRRLAAPGPMSYPTKMIVRADVRILELMGSRLTEVELSNYRFEGLGLSVAGAGSGADSGVSITP